MSNKTDYAVSVVGSMIGIVIRGMLLTFGVLAAVVLIGMVLPSHPSDHVSITIQETAK